MDERPGSEYVFECVFSLAQVPTCDAMSFSDLFAVTHLHNNDYQGDRTQVRILTLEYVQ